MYHATTFELATRSRGPYEITEQVERIVQETGVARGLCTVFVHHTSASLMICENADPGVVADLERFLTRLVPDGDSLFRHVAEGPDDMPAHVRSILTQPSISIPIERSRPDLGVWQGIFLYEHRTHSHRRRITVSVLS